MSRNVLEDIVDDTNVEQVKRNYQLTQGLHPEQAAKDFKVSQTLSVPQDLVQNQREFSYNKAEQTNTLSHLVDNPGATQFMSNRHNAAMSKDDVDKLVKVATMSTWDRVDYGMGAGFKDVGRNIASLVRGIADFQLAYSARIRAEAREEGRTAPGIFSPADKKAWEEAKIKVTSSLRDEELQAISEWAESVEKSEALTVDELPRRPGMQGYIDDVIRTAPQIAMQIGVTTVAGPQAGMVFMGSQVAGGKYRKLVDQDKVDKERALVASFLDAAIQAPLERIGLTKALKAWTPSVGTLSRKAFSVIEAMGTEFLTELVQKYPEAITDTWANAEKKGHTAQDQVDIFIRDFWDITAQGVYEGLVAAPFGGLTTSAGIVFQEFQKKTTENSAGEEYHDQQVAANKQINDTKLKGRSEEKTEEFLDHHGYDQDTFLTAEGVEVLFQAGNIEALEKLGIETEDIPNIQTTGVDTALKLSVLHSKLSPEEFTTIAEHITPGRDIPTMAQTTRSREEFTDSMEAQIEAVKEQRQAESDFEKERQEVFEDIKAKRLQLGRVTQTSEDDAAYMSSFVATYADKYGYTPREVYQAFVPEFRAGRFEGSVEQKQLQTRLLQEGLGSLEDVKNSWKEKGVSEQVTEKEGVIKLSKIRIDKEARKQGVGTEAMNELIAYADKTGQKVVLNPSKDFGASSVNRLKKFYKQFGFVENKGKNRDFEISEDMYRDPTPTDGKLLQQAKETDPGHDVAEEVNANNPGNDLRYDGQMDLSALNRPNIYQFTAYDGVAKGATFTSDTLTAEAVEDRLNNMISAREGQKLLQEKVEVHGFGLPRQFESKEDAEKFISEQKALKKKIEELPENPEVIDPGTSGFEKWTEGSEVVEDSQDFDFKVDTPYVVRGYHGTTHDFRVVDPGLANIENHLGKGFYTTSSLDDVKQHYEGFGPDLTQRIELRKEQIESELEFNVEEVADFHDIDVEILEKEVEEQGEDIVAERLANEALVGKFGETGVVMDVYTKMLRPLILTPEGGTSFFREIDRDYYRDIAEGEVDKEDFTDEEGDFDEDIYEDEIEEKLMEAYYEDYDPQEFGDVSELYKAIRSASFEFSNIDADILISEMREEFFFDEGEKIDAQKVFDWLKENENVVFAEDTESPGLAGREFLRSLAEQMGYDGIIMDAGYANEKWNMGVSEGTWHFISWTPNNVKSATRNIGAFSLTDPDIFLQEKPKKTAFGSFDAPDRIITIFEKADSSTFLHESGHAFFDFMSRNALYNPDAPQALKDDWTAIAKHVGNDGSSPLTEEQHETLAGSLEAYFMEGKAPSSRLRRAFQNFATWLKGLYNNLPPNAKLTDELRALFARMFATELEIDEVQTYYDAQRPYFTDLEQEEQRTYTSLRKNAELDAESRRLKKYIDAYLRAVGGEAQLEKDALEVINKIPVYASMDQSVAAGGLPVDIVDYFLGEESRKKLSKKRVGLVTKAGGANPDEIAANNGFDTVEIMLVQMLDAKLKTAVKDTMVISKLEEVQKDMLDHVDSDIVAEEDYHSDARMKVLAAELQLLQQRANLKKGQEKATATRLKTQAIRDVAKETLLSKTVKEASDYNRFSRAEAKAAKTSRQAFRKEDLEAAEISKRQELLNHALTIESFKIRNEVDKAVKMVKKKSRSKSIHQDALDLIKDISVRFGFQNRPSGVSHQEAVEIYRAWLVETDTKGDPHKDIDYSAWETAQINNGYGVSLSAVVKNQGNNTFYKDMSVQSFRSVIDSVKQISEVDLGNRKILYQGKKIDLDEAVDLLSAQLEKTFETKPTEFFTKKKNWLSMLDASMLKMEFLIENIDGEEIGIWHEMVFQRIAKAEETENIAVIAADKDIKKIFDKHYTKKEQWKMFSKRNTPIPEINESMTRAQLVRVFLDFGNLGNYTKRRDGHGWDDTQMEAIKNHLTKSDIDFAQDIWDYIETFKKDSFALEKRMTGREPDAVLPTPIETKFGVYKGGYFPISFDPQKANITESRQQIEQAVLYGTPNYTHAMTQHGHLKQRQETAGGQVLSSELTDITKHVSGVIHDITHREAVVDTAKIFRDKRMEAVMRDRLGEEVTKVFMPWLKDSANTDPITSTMERMAKSFRIGTTVAKLGKFSVMLQQLAGFTQTVKVLGKESYRIPMEFINMVKNPNASYTTVTEKSGFMKTRITNYNREAHDAFKGLNVYKKTPQKLGEFAMKGIGIIQFMTDLPTWNAAYESHLAKNNNETKAIVYADSVVRKSQGGGGVKDLARVQRGNEYFRLVTMFYSFMNLAYQHYAASGRGKKFDLKGLSSSILFIGLLGPIAAEILSGRPPEEDENWAAWVAKLEARFYTGLFPVFRDIAGAAGSGFGYRISPIEQPIETVIKGTVKAVVKQDLTALIRPAAEVGGVVFRMPTDQMFRTSEAFWHWLSGDPDFEIQHIVYGGKYNDRRKR